MKDSTASAYPLHAADRSQAVHSTSYLVELYTARYASLLYAVLCELDAADAAASGWCLLYLLACLLERCRLASNWVIEQTNTGQDCIQPTQALTWLFNIRLVQSALFIRRCAVITVPI